MKKHMKIIVGISMVILIALGLVFYWYSYRPTGIVRYCSLEAREKAIEKRKNTGATDGKFNAEDRDAYYKWCLQEKGLVK